MDKNLALSVFAVLIVGAIATLVVVKDKTPQPIFGNGNATSTDQTEVVVDLPVKYECKDGEKIAAAFENHTAIVSLPDGRQLTFNELISASGSRFGNSDTQMEFWIKGNEASVFHNNELIYSCVEVTPVIPEEVSEVTIKTKLGEEVSALGVKIMPLEIIEDSRCPIDVVCIQAGTVRLQTKLTSALGTASQTFTFNEPITTEAEMITLIAAEPAKKSTETVVLGQYVFTFKVEKR